VKQSTVLNIYFKMSPHHIIYTQHASFTSLTRKIQEQWIAKTLSSPSKIELDAKNSEVAHAFLRIPEYGNRTLRVIYKQTAQTYTVITAYFDRTRKDIP